MCSSKHLASLRARMRLFGSVAHLPTWLVRFNIGEHATLFEVCIVCNHHKIKENYDISEHTHQHSVFLFSMFSTSNARISSRMWPSASMVVVLEQLSLTLTSVITGLLSSVWQWAYSSRSHREWHKHISSHINALSNFQKLFKREWKRRGRKRKQENERRGYRHNICTLRCTFLQW